MGAGKEVPWGWWNGLTENAGPEIDRPKKNNRLKMSDMKMTDQITGMILQDMKLTDQTTKHEIAGHENTWHENTGHENTGHEMKMQDRKMQRQELLVMDSIRQLIYVNYVQISPPKRDNIQKSQSHVRQTLSTLYLKSFNEQTI